MDCHKQKHVNNIQLLTDYQLPASFESSRHVRRIRNKSNKHKKQDRMVANAIQKMFGKCVEIDNKECNLPQTNTMFTENSWMVEDLQRLKTDLNNVKSNLNDYDLTEWRHHTKKRNYAGHIIWQVRKEINPEFLTQAWCKFYENLSFFQLISAQSLRMEQLKSIHLCEAPGAFITALNHWLKLNAPTIDWDWTATTLNPNYEGNSLSYMLNDDRFIQHTVKNWYFGVDNTGNLMNLQNLDALIESVEGDRDKIMLITADGSIDCSNIPGEQEKFVSHLHYCETIAALHLLSEGGNFLIKLFTIFEYQTICLMYLLSCCFNKIFIRKPASSKEGNSEVYIACLDFKGSDYTSAYLNTLREQYEKYTDRAMFRISDIPSSFIEQIIKSGEFFKSHQCEVISSNVKTFNSMTDETSLDIKKIRKGIADHFIKCCKLKKLPSADMDIIGNDIMDQSGRHILDDKCYYNSYSDRQLKDSMKPEERLLILNDNFKHINETNYVASIQFTDDNLEALKITTAIPYINIQSSKFCQPKILKIYSLAYEIMSNLTCNWQFPNNEAVVRYINTNEGYKFLVFHYTLEYDGFNTIEKIQEGMMKLEWDQTLVLVGYSLLTQFNVGILYTLAHTFKHVEMRVIDELGCVITLRNYVCKTNIIECVKTIFEASILAKNNNEIISSVITFTRLCDCALYPKILEMNHLIIKRFVHLVIMAMDKGNTK